jgi:hypothetical protein
MPKTSELRHEPTSGIDVTAHPYASPGHAVDIASVRHRWYCPLQLPRRLGMKVSTIAHSANHKLRAIGVASFSALILIAPNAPAGACPDLSGTFLCPGWQTQPAQRMIVTTILKPDGSATYEFKYLKDGRETSSESHASAKGMRSPDGHFVSCTAAEMVSKAPNAAGRGTINFINDEGNYEADNSGRTQIICIRQQQ